MKGYVMEFSTSEDSDFYFQKDSMVCSGCGHKKKISYPIKVEKLRHLMIDFLIDHAECVGKTYKEIIDEWEDTNEDS